MTTTDGDDALGGRKAIWFSRVSRAISHLTVRLGKAGSVFGDASPRRHFCCLTIE